MLIHTIDKFIETIEHPILSGTFLADKHNPYMLLTYHEKVNRSVLSFELVKNMYSFFTSGNYELNLFWNKSYKNYYYQLIPTDSAYAVPASGVVIASGTPILYSTYDSLAIVDGSNQGLHGFGENIRTIYYREKKGDLIYLKKVKKISHI